MVVCEMTVCAQASDDLWDGIKRREYNFRKISIYVVPEAVRTGIDLKKWRGDPMRQSIPQRQRTGNDLCGGALLYLSLRGAVECNGSAKGGDSHARHFFSGACFC